jgi:hypothetical protein
MTRRINFVMPLCCNLTPRDIADAIHANSWGTSIRAWIRHFLQKSSDPALIAQRSLILLPTNFILALKFSKPIARCLARMFYARCGIYYQKQHLREALDISILIRDMDFLSAACKRGELCRPEYYFDYARLLIDDVRPGEAIELLVYMEKQEDKRYADKTICNELLITALIEDGRINEAMDKSIAAFSFQCDTRFYHLYAKSSGKENDNVQTFLNIAKEKGLDAYICFAADIARLI